MLLKEKDFINSEFIACDNDKVWFRTNYTRSHLSVLKVRFAVIEFWGPQRPFVRLRSRDTLSKDPRNRLCRKFGADDFLIVRFDTPYLSPADKYAFSQKEPLFDEDTLQFINAQRLFSLFHPVTSGSGDHAPPLSHPLRPEVIRLALRSERTHAFLRYQKSLAKYSALPLSIAGKEFKILLTTSSGVHALKYVYTSVDRPAILDWAMRTKEYEKLKSVPIKLALRLAMLNSTSVALDDITEIRAEFVADRYAKDHRFF